MIVRIHKYIYIYIYVYKWHVWCDQAAAKELINYVETEEEKNALKQKHRVLLWQMVDLVDEDDTSPTVGEAEPLHMKHRHRRVAKYEVLEGGLVYTDWNTDDVLSQGK